MHARGACLITVFALSVAACAAAAPRAGRARRRRARPRRRSRARARRLKFTSIIALTSPLGNGWRAGAHRPRRRGPRGQPHMLARPPAGGEHLRRQGRHERQPRVRPEGRLRRVARDPRLHRQLRRRRHRVEAAGHLRERHVAVRADEQERLLVGERHRARHLRYVGDQGARQEVVDAGAPGHADPSVRGRADREDGGAAEGQGRPDLLPAGHDRLRAGRGAGLRRPTTRRSACCRSIPSSW